MLFNVKTNGLIIYLFYWEKEENTGGLHFILRKHNENFDKRVGVNRSPEAAYSYWYALGHLEKYPLIAK
ncbi:hypothetical protein FACS189428_2820 [Clostridia bacterium]|nr:hypothetical protein FACS189428_2820 [Clostridia bacterium]